VECNGASGVGLRERALGDNVIEIIINKSEKVKALKNKVKDKELSKTGVIPTRYGLYDTVVARE
jgi:hypothetical protein